MAFESLTERLQGVFKNIRGKKKLSEKDVQEVTKEIRLALLEADVALPVVKTFIKRVRERAVGHEIIDTLDPTQQIVKIVNEELTEILGKPKASKTQIGAWHDEILEGCLVLFPGERDVVFHMKEIWFYLIRFFPEKERLLKQMKKCQSLTEYRLIVQQIIS